VKKQQQGFTLVEIALVLVVIGLILGGLLKGQALIDNARARSMATQIDNISAAWYGFIDRYRALPGDFETADTRIEAAMGTGDGNGRINTATEAAQVWQHLSASGFVAGNFDGDGAAGELGDTACANSTCPQNPYGGFMKISSSDGGNGPLQLITGENVPSRVLMQLDLKLDDGNADSGRFRVFADTANSCANGADWVVDETGSSCSGVWLGL